ncbi:PREDICTED: uncharacterized protein LOC107357522 [Acropora digitifera]|uniref:uncharacterized protein LOC107357522 n=1 Tax=Acropora digitifera TaxID=70779 RepID=UPI00077A8E5C|nr:PREDICTED: uncharacterized protein LOC107357522 [Acropora digitifera]
MADACTPRSSEESDSNESVGLSSSDEFSKSSSASDSSEDDSRSGLGEPAAPSRKRVCYQSAEGAKGRVRLVGSKQANTLSGQEMEDLAAWVTSEEEASAVEREIRSKLLDSPRISFSEGSKKFAEHLLCDDERANFNLLMVGFCRRFSSLAEDCYRNVDKKDMKARFSCSWMKVMSNFQIGKQSQERIILERLIKNGPTSSAEDVHRVISVVHELVYTTAHDHIRIKKEEGSSAREHSVLGEESDHTLFRYCGASLQRMIKFRKKSLLVESSKAKGKMKRPKPSSSRRASIEEELKIIECLILKDKSSISEHLKNLDEGNLTFPKHELLPWLRSVDTEVRQFATDSNLKKFPTKFIKMCQNIVKLNERLEMDFRLIVSSLLNSESTVNTELVNSIHHVLVSKLANTRINEYLNAKVERDLKTKNKVVDADNNLRTTLKSYALQTKRK